MVLFHLKTHPFYRFPVCCILPVVAVNGMDGSVFAFYYSRIVKTGCFFFPEVILQGIGFTIGPFKRKNRCRLTNLKNLRLLALKHRSRQKEQDKKQGTNH